MTATRQAIALMVITSFIFAVQDAFSRHLASTYSVLMVIMIRYWFAAAYAIAWAARGEGGIARVARTDQPLLQIVRGILLATEVCVMVLAFVLLGLIESHAVFAIYPLLIAALSGPILGEHVGWRRWVAICVGFLGILIILQPGLRVFSPEALVPLLAAVLFALYGLLTRYASRKDSTQTSFFWMATTGAVAMSVIGVWFWEPMTRPDWVIMGILGVTATVSHWTLTKAYELAEASAVQPFAYFQLVFAAAVAMIFLGERLELNVAIGSGIVVAAGLFTLWRERVAKAA